MMGFGSEKSRFGVFVMGFGWEKAKFGSLQWDLDQKSLNLDLCGGIWVRKVQIWVFGMRFGSERSKLGGFVMGFEAGRSKPGLVLAQKPKFGALCD